MCVVVCSIDSQWKLTYRHLLAALLAVTPWWSLRNAVERQEIRYICYLKSKPFPVLWKTNDKQYRARIQHFLQLNRYWRCIFNELEFTEINGIVDRKENYCEIQELIRNMESEKRKTWKQEKSNSLLVHSFWKLKSVEIDKIIESSSTWRVSSELELSITFYPL